MKTVNEYSGVVGKTMAAIVIGPRGNRQAVLTNVTAHRMQSRSGLDVVFSGPVRVAEKASKHVKGTIVRLVKACLNFLGVDYQPAQICFQNVGSVSSCGASCELHGFSADLAIFLVLISLSLDLPINQSMAATGHVSSLNGDINLVEAIPEKIAAAEQSDLGHFILPDVLNDEASRRLIPNQHNANLAAVKSMRNVNAAQVDHLQDCIPLAFPEVALISSALNLGYFEIGIAKQDLHGGLIDAFAGNMTERFWTAIEGDLCRNQMSIHSLLRAFANYHSDRSNYPQGFGRRLFSVLVAVPARQRRDINFPLLPIHTYASLCTHAGEHDSADVMLLHDAVAGRFHRQNLHSYKSERQKDSDSILNWITHELSHESLGRFSVPIHEARASFVLHSVAVSDHEEFIDVISTFYAHLLRYLNPGNGVAGHWEADALDLVDQAFRNHGGENAAFAEARMPTNRGGLLFVLDEMAQQLCRNEEAKYGNYVLKVALDPLEFEKRVILFRELLDSLPKNSEHASTPPEKFAAATNYEDLIRVYVQAIENLSDKLRSI